MTACHGLNCNFETINHHGQSRPTSTTTANLDPTQVICLVYTALVTPYEIAFIDPGDEVLAVTRTLLRGRSAARDEKQTEAVSRRAAPSVCV